MRWWMSFCDPSKPTGEQFLGLCIVDAVDEVSATKIAWALGINPGGEIAFMGIDESRVSMLSFDLEPYCNRFIPRGEALALSYRIGRELDA